MENVKPIETVYKGYRFRSRLEARWAVFFDAAGIKYQYEPQGFELEDGTRYLPDFYFPDFELYGEVKGDEAQYHKDLKRMLRFLAGGNAPIKRLMVFGNIPYSPESNGVYWFPVFYWETLHDSVAREYKTIVMGEHPFFALNWRTAFGAPYFDGDTCKDPYMQYGIHLFSFPGDTVPEEDKTQWEEISERLDPVPDILLNSGRGVTVYGADNPTFRGYAAQTGFCFESPYEKARKARFEFGETPK